ncbi:MAG: hypothetical protein AAF533_24320 [Acidobacteriota bacterium]
MRPTIGIAAAEAWLDALARRPERPGPYGLELMTELLERLDRPQDRFAAIQVAGSRGKGSTCSLLSAALHAGDRHVGLTTSPHLVDVTERLRLNERDVDAERLLGWVGEIGAVRDELEPSYFELLMAVAFHAFAEEQVDVGVIEVGLGGRLDASTTCQPIVSVITRIGLEHRDRLGPDLTSIAGEKAGIIRPGVPVVLGPNEPEVEDVVRARADELSAPLRIVTTEEVEAAPATSLSGPAQAENAAVAAAVLDELARVRPELGITSDQRDAGFAAVRCPGRLQLLSPRPDATRLGARELLVDVSHDPTGIANLRRHVESLDRAVAPVFACLADKELAAIATELAQGPRLSHATFHVPELGGPRTQPAADIVQTLTAAGLTAQPHPDLVTALTTAADQDALVVAFGSFRVAGEAIRLHADTP